MESARVAVLAAGADVLIAVAYAGAGALLLRRMRASSHRRAGDLFALWWFGIAATGVITLALQAAARAGAAPMTLDLIDQASLATYATALAGFVSYVAFLWTGSHRATFVVFGVYAALVAWSLAAALDTPATGYVLDGWVRDVERPENFGPPRALTAALLALPALGGIAGYAALYRAAPDASARTRIALVTSALLAWLVGSGLASAPALQPRLDAQLASRAMIVCSAALLLVAYRPPTLRAPDAGARARRAALAARLDERVRELV